MGKYKGFLQIWGFDVSQPIFPAHSFRFSFQRSSVGVGELYLTFWYGSYQYESCLLLPFHLLQGFFPCINFVCYGDSLLLLVAFRSILLQLVYLFLTVGENIVAVG